VLEGRGGGGGGEESGGVLVRLGGTFFKNKLPEWPCANGFPSQFFSLRVSIVETKIPYPAPPWPHFDHLGCGSFGPPMGRLVRENSGLFFPAGALLIEAFRSTAVAEYPIPASRFFFRSGTQLTRISTRRL